MSRFISCFIINNKLLYYYHSSIAQLAEHLTVNQIVPGSSPGARAEQQIIRYGMFYIVYKITNLLNNKIYVGVHKTLDINDNYMGSSRSLRFDINKHGIEHFKKEILHLLDSDEEMYNKEREIVNEDFVKLDNTYNKILGGTGSFKSINEKKLNLYGNNGKFGYGGENLIPFYGYKKCHTPEIHKKIGKILSDNIKNGKTKPGFQDKSHSEGTKKLIGTKSKEHQKGKGNSQYGTKWIYSLTEKISKKIHYDSVIPEGWAKGRKIKFD